MVVEMFVALIDTAMADQCLIHLQLPAEYSYRFSKGDHATLKREQDPHVRYSPTTI